MQAFLKQYTGTGAFVALETAPQDTRNSNTGSKGTKNFIGRLIPLAANSSSLQLSTVSAGTNPVTLAAPVSGVAYESYECRVPTDLTQIFLKGDTMTLQAIGHLVGD